MNPTLPFIVAQEPSVTDLPRCNQSPVFLVSVELALLVMSGEGAPGRIPEAFVTRFTQGNHRQNIGT